MAEKLKVYGVEDPVRRLRKIHDLLDDPIGIQDVFVRAGEMLRDEAVLRVPVHSGRLRDAIRVERRGKKLPVAVLIVRARDVRYVSFVELGSRHAAAQPFLRPTVAAKGLDIVAFIGREIRGMIDQAIT